MNVMATSGRIALELEFNATPERVFARWVNPAALAGWFAPVGYTTTACAVDAREGGAWELEFAAEDGSTYREAGTFVEVDAPRRLVLTLTQYFGGDVGPETVITVTFAPVGEGRTRTRMQFVQEGFTDAAHREGNLEGWAGCFVKFASGVAGEAEDAAAEQEQEEEIRALFAAWADASAAKDLDASMEPIADDVVSYEHEAPMQYRGADALRPICAAGFEMQPDNFRWDVPDLQVIVRGDIAVTWGLNHMHAEPQNGEATSMWSRGTRVFQQRDGRWQMIHQHVSFPMDTASGQVVMEHDAAAG